MRKPYFKNLTPAHEEFLIEHLKKEWLDSERAAKRHELVEKAKNAGAIAGKIILGALLISGAVTVAAVAPKAFVVFSPNNYRHRRHFKTDRLSRDLISGNVNSLWCYKKVGDGKYNLRLTPHGRKIALRSTLRNFKLGRTERWDGLYRTITFDVSRKHNSARDGFRRRLLEIGMHSLQNSVFIYPYPCREEVMFWASVFNISECVHIIEGRIMTGDESHLKEIFKL